MRVRLITLREELARRPEIEVGSDGRPIGRSQELNGPSREDPGAGAAGSTAATSIPDPGDPSIIRPSRVTRKTL